MRVATTMATMGWLAFCLVAGGCQSGKSGSDYETIMPGLQVHDTVVGTGALAEDGDVVRVHYTGWLHNDGVQVRLELTPSQPTPPMLQLALSMSPGTPSMMKPTLSPISGSVKPTLMVGWMLPSTTVIARGGVLDTAPSSLLVTVRVTE